ncbi:MAG: ABC transporter permease [Moraxellaceae bacterium]|jgi:nitrate/nitrite transport system permease protein|nr:MAG: ABC transporter permease [Moraxellaceae bacterium]
MSASLTSSINPLMVSLFFKNCIKAVALPFVGIAVFLLLWEFGSSKVQTSLGQFPGPAIVLNQVQGLYQEYKEDKASASAFYERQEKRFAQAREQDPNYVAEFRQYSGKPTFVQQIFTSLKTVFTGFLLASLIAIPLGIAIGLSSNLYSAINPLIQLFKPISPLAWLPLVTIVVSAVYSNPDGIPKSFITSAMTVMLCSLWPTLINTAVGVTSVSSDLINVSRVLRLNWLRHVRSIVLPSSVPMIFTGLRLSLGIAWMVLIAAEMLAQNPGLGKFVWDEFQNGSSDSLGRIMVAVLTIGLIGYLLDRGMLLLQKMFSWDKQAIVR